MLPTPFPRSTAVVASVLAALMSACAAPDRPADARRKPNIVLILADDLGYNELGCFGQTKIETPNLDRLAAEGMRFTQFYSGSPVCAPSRCVLLTGKHTGHAFIRGNKEVGGWERGDPEGQWPIPPEEVTLGELLQAEGYETAAIGKWGLGGPGSTGAPNGQGFDLFYGYLCQRQAHNYYPEHLWRNGEQDVLRNAYFAAHERIAEPPADEAGWRRFAGVDYAPDLLIEEALAFVRENREQPFFLYLPTPVPHVAIQVPDDSLAEYSGRFDDAPYLGQQGYLPHPEPRAGYAAMVSRMDRDVGRLLDLLDELGLAEDTIVLFSSDNGPTFNGGSDSEFFESNRPFRGLKCSVYEGGIRVPTIVRWPGKVEPGSVSGHVGGAQDVLPTLVEIAGGRVPGGLDGISFVPTLRGLGGQREHDYLYWEYPERDGQQALLVGRWKAVRRNLSRDGDRAIALYDLSTDIGEQRDVAAEHEDVVAEIAAILRAARVPSELFPMPGLDSDSR